MSIDGFTSRATALRETSKWIAVVFLGTSAVLFSGMSFVNLQVLASGNLWYLALPMTVIPVAAAAWAVREAAGVISKEPTAIEDLLPNFAGKLKQKTFSGNAEAQSSIEDMLPAVIVTYGGITGLEQRLLLAHESVQVAKVAYSRDGQEQRRLELQAAYRNLDELQPGVAELVACADYLEVRKQYQSCKLKFLVALCLALFGIVGAAYIAVKGSPESSDSQQAYASIDEATPVVVHLQPSSDLVYAEENGCPVWEGRTAVAVGGTFDSPTLIFSDSMPASFAKRVPANLALQCSKPWMWRPEKLSVVLTPEP